MTSVVYVAHYPSNDFEYSELIPLSQLCYKKFTMIISKARAKRKHSNEDVLESGQVKQRRCQRRSLGVNFSPTITFVRKKGKLSKEKYKFATD